MWLSSLVTDRYLRLAKSVSIIPSVVTGPDTLRTYQLLIDVSRPIRVRVGRRGEFGEFVELLPAQQRLDEASWYKGTADAVYQNLDIIRNHAQRIFQ